MPTDSHGFIVDVGFATFACETSDSALSILGSYLKQPAVFVEDLKATRKDKESGNDTKLVRRDIPVPGPIIKTPCGGAKSGDPNF